MESAVAVCGPKLSIDLLEGLESLLNKSLLLLEDGPEGEPRFLILETIHEYARERLEESDEAEVLRSRHAHYFLELAERAEPELRKSEQGYWFDRLEVEQDNLRTALAWSLGGSDSMLGLRLVGALRDFWYYQGQKAEGLRWADRALEQTEKAPRVVRARVLFTAGMLDWAGKYQKQAKAHLRESLAIFRELGHRRGTAWSLMWLSATSIGQPDEYEEAISTCEEALASFRKLDDKPSIAQTLNILGELTRLHNDLERAKTAYEECLALCRETGDRRRESMSLCSLGFVAQRQGKYDEAEALIKDGTELAWVLRFSSAVALGLAAMAGPLASRGHPERAARLLGASETLFGAIGEDPYPSDQPEIDRYTAEVRDQLDEQAFEKLLAEGRAMSAGDAISYALGRNIV